MKHRNYYLTTSGNQFAVIDKSPGHYQQVAICDTIEEAGEAINQHSNSDQTTTKKNDNQDPRFGI